MVLQLGRIILLRWRRWPAIPPFLVFIYCGWVVCGKDDWDEYLQCWCDPNTLWDDTLKCYSSSPANDTRKCGFTQVAVDWMKGYRWGELISFTLINEEWRNHLNENGCVSLSSDRGYRGRLKSRKGEELKVKGGDPVSRNSLKFHSIPISGFLKSFYDYYLEKELWHTMSWSMMGSRRRRRRRVSKNSRHIPPIRF